jgi:beta-glucanase (GH16 family)
MMKRYVSVLLAGVALACAAITAPSVAATYDFHDEFSGTSLNTAVWTAETRNFDGVCAAASNVRLSGGYLQMTARRGGTSDCPWVGSRVVTKDKRYLGYGLVRARVTWNPAPGFWGGFVMFGRASGGSRLADGEIDTEIRDGLIHYRLWSVDSAGQRCGIAIDKPNTSLDHWHTFGVNRQPTYTRFLLDGVTQATITKTQMVAKGCTWPFERQFSLVLSARAGGWGGTPDPDEFPVTTLVDWVRK